MNKTAVIAAVVIVLVVLGAGVLVLSNRTPKSNLTPGLNTTQQNFPSPTEAAMQKKSLKDFLGLGLTQECKYTDNSGNEGLVQATGKKVHGEFTSTSDGQTNLSNMVSDGETIYIWVEGQKTGMKMAVSSMDDLSDAPDAQKGSVNINQQVDYKCGSWVVDNSVFDLPPDVQFQDLNSLMQGSQSGAQGTPQVTGAYSSEECKPCQSLTGSEKEQCLKTLGC